jgi:hypothetical protein
LQPQPQSFLQPQQQSFLQPQPQYFLQPQPQYFLLWLKAPMAYLKWLLMGRTISLKGMI